MAPVGSNTRPSASLPPPHPAPVSTIIIISTVIPSTLVLLMLVCTVVVIILIVRWRITRKQVDTAHEHKGKLLSLSSRSMSLSPCFMFLAESFCYHWPLLVVITLSTSHSWLWLIGSVYQSGMGDSLKVHSQGHSLHFHLFIWTRQDSVNLC